MSRCFPYPPPGYVRNPVAVAEVETTTKLQKEREKTEKKKEKRNDKKALQQEKKKEKRNDKKALQQGGGEASKHSKRSHKKRRHEEICIVGQECKKASKESVEQLEKSGLSEEHGAPCFIQRVHGSPESSQDSSKRRKVLLPSPSHNRNGNILRIKIRRDQGSPAAMLENSTVLEQSPVQQMGPGSYVSSKRNAIQPHNSKVMVKSATALPQSIKSDSQPVLKQVNVQRPADILQRVDLPTTAKVMQKVDPSAKVMQKIGPLTTAKVMQKIDPLTTAKVMQKIDPRLSVNAAIGRLDPPSAKVMGSAVPSPAKLTRRVVPPPSKAAQRVDLPPAKVLQRINPPLPSKVLQRDDPPSSEAVLQKETSAIAFCQPDEQQPPLLQKSMVPVETHVIKQQQTNSLHKEEPCFSGRSAEAAAVPEVKQSKSDRKKSRKAEKKERKFGDLFVTWNPPSFEMENTGDLDDHDWLLGGARKPDASMNDCTASDGLVPFQSMEQQFSLQPRAIHLPDLHVYQLPYVVPF